MASSRTLKPLQRKALVDCLRQPGRMLQWLEVPKGSYIVFGRIHRFPISHVRTMEDHLPYVRWYESKTPISRRYCRHFLCKNLRQQPTMRRLSKSHTSNASMLAFHDCSLELVVPPSYEKLVGHRNILASAMCKNFRKALHSLFSS